MHKERVTQTEQQEPFVVAIGASAGGLEAIHEFFDNMPSNGNFSFVIIQHLSSDYKSLLVELLSKHTNMKVVEAQHEMGLERGHVYVIPNDKLLRVKDGRLQLSTKNFEKSPNTAIDTFLKSLADDQGNKAIAVILSGTGTDGTRGIEAVQQNGGMVLVQDPASAKFDGMPNSAIAAGYADFILSPGQMPEEIVNYIKDRPARLQIDNKPDENALPEVMKLIEKHCGYDFYNYKSPTIIRRIIRRMNQLGKKQFSDYLDLLRQSREECKILGKEFLIGVTKFFRDSAAFDIFANEVIPDVVRNKGEGDLIKVWVTACSTGQEAYSIAILLNEQLRRVNKSLQVKIFATDLDIEAIEFASKGIFPAASLTDLDEDLLHRYFEKQGSNYTIIPHVRKQIVFARHNILKDPPFIKNDIISCRNMLIYMNSILQRKVFSTLSYSLNTGGFLFLGPSEVPSSISSTLSEVSSKWKIYRKISNEKYYQPHYDTTRSLKSSREIQSSKESAITKELAEDFKAALTDEFRFAGIYIDQNYEIKEAVGDFRRYLSLPQKIVNLNLLKMVSPELAMALNSGLRKVAKEGKKVTLHHLKSRGEKEERYINVYIKPPLHREGYTLIVFGESNEVVVPKGGDSLPHGDPQTAAYIVELEDELKELRNNLQMAVESLETTNEELQSSNEELLSANEELQSSNEELQSLNEELHTLNTEHQLRIKELVELNDDLDNYFKSTEIGQVFVGEDLRIRKFNPAAVQLVNLIDSDIGRPIEHISTNLRNESLAADIRFVIQKQAIVEKEVELEKGVVIILKILPYVRQTGEVDGVVITFFDITAIRELNQIIKGVFNTSLSSIMAFKAVRNEQKAITDFVWTAGNYAADKFLARESTDYLNRSLKEEYPALLANGLFEKYIGVVEEEKPLHTEMLFTQQGQGVWYELTATKMLDGFVLTLSDINEKKVAEEKLRKNYYELIKTKENLKILNSSLEEKVALRTAELAAGEERFRLIAAAASDIVWDWNLVNNEIWWSESFYKIFGYAKDNGLSQTSAFWMQHIHPDDKEGLTKQIYDAVNKGTTWVARYRQRKEDGCYATILGKGSVIADEFGTPYRMVGAMTDITEAVQAEQQLREKNAELQRMMEEFRFVTNFMPQLVWSNTPGGDPDFYNKGWTDYTGLAMAEVKTGWVSLVHPEDQQRTTKIWKHSLVTGEPFEVECRLRRADGEYHWFLCRALPLRNEEGAIVKWFGTCTDIHDQKVMNDILEQKVRERTRELLKSNDELEDMNTELMQFASVASHDLKEPLRKIHIFANIIKDRYLKESHDGAMDYMNRIINSSARMTKLINDLLSYSRLSVTHFFESVNLNRIMSEVLSDLELSIQEKGAKVEMDDLPEIQAVPGQMRQVFQNIISNSLKFTQPDMPPHITIRVAYLKELSLAARPGASGDYVRITLSDNGIGFNEQYAAKIFTIFQRLHSREKYDGTGIGLAITKKIIDRHNGLITAKSEEGKGSSFIIILPIKQGGTEVTVGSSMETARN